MAIINSYLQMLAGPQRRALMELLAYLAAIDGDVSFEEVVFIGETSNQLGVDETAAKLLEAVAEKGLEAVCTCFDRPDVKAIALAHLIGIAFADGTYQDSERDGIRAISQAMGVTEDKVKSLEGWVAQGLQWEAQGRLLLALSSD